MRSFTPPPLPSLQKNNQTNFKKYPTKTNTIQTKTNPNLVFMVFFDHDQTPEEIIEKICYLAGKLTNPSLKQARIIHWGLLAET